MQIAARIGSAIAPWVAKALKGVHVALPFSLMGASSFVCGILLLWLPETCDKDMTETIQDQLDANSNGEEEELMDMGGIAAISLLSQHPSQDR